MAEVNDPSAQSREEEGLKYLGFVQRATLRALVYLSSLYEYAKEKSDPLKTGVESVEGTVKALVDPVYQRFHAVPLQFLYLADRKVDETIVKVNEHLSPAVKQASIQVYWAARKVPETARSVTSEVQRSCLKDTARCVVKTAYAKCVPLGRDLYAKYEPVAERYAVTTWVALHRLPLFSEVVQTLIPTLSYFSDKYNEAVRSTASRGYAISVYLPLIPIDKIAKIFSQAVPSSPEKKRS